MKSWHCIAVTGDVGGYKVTLDALVNMAATFTKPVPITAGFCETAIVGRIVDVDLRGDELWGLLDMDDRVAPAFDPATGEIIAAALTTAPMIKRYDQKQIDTMRADHEGRHGT